MIKSDLDLFRFPNLSSIDGVAHAISTRNGGVSGGRFATLNVSYTVGDEEANVEENLRRLAHAMGTERSRLFAAYQVHGNQVVVVDESTPPRPRCDVLITRSSDRVLMLRFADCTPVLLADRVRRVVGAVHAGWRGTAVRAVNAAVTAMQQRFGSDPRDIVSGIGPAIGPCCYTVGPNVAEYFADRAWAVSRSNDGGTRLDLWEANRRALLEAGVPAEQVDVAGICTQCQADRFFSHRANGGQPSGRFAALVGLSAGC